MRVQLTSARVATSRAGRPPATIRPGRPALAIGPRWKRPPSRRCPAPLFGRFLLEDVDSDEDGVIFAVILVPVHRRPRLRGRVTRVERM